MKTRKWDDSQNIIWKVIAPVILLLFPLIKVHLGVDYMDSMYSPGNFRFFTEMEGMWVIATFLANVKGFLIGLLPGGDTYLGMRIYTALAISIMAVLSYSWLKRRIPAWLVAAGEVIAIGFCWCPTTILYNYMTYFYVLLATIFLYYGLTKQKKGCLAAAGVFLGLNLMVRFPNILETGFILAVWYYGFLNRKKLKEAVQDTLWCMAGYFGCVLIVMLCIVALYGGNAYVEMIGSLFSMTETATSYTPFDMLYSIFNEYLHGLKWPLGMLGAAGLAVIMFLFFKGKYIWCKKIITIGGILLLFRFYYARGMFNVKYYTYPSMFQWANTLLLISIGLFLWSLFNRKESKEMKLLSALMLLTLAIIPIGSNNNIYPNMNNLFLVAPLGIYQLYRICLMLKNYEWSFPIKAMAVAVITAVFFQSVGFGSVFVFRGAREGEKRDTKIENNVILKGVYTNAEKAEAIEGLTIYCENNNLIGEGKSLLLFGHIPGVSYFLDTPAAISTSWPDLESYNYSVFEKDMEALETEMDEDGTKRPTVIVSFGVSAVLENDANGMEEYEKSIESGESSLVVLKESKKLPKLLEFMKKYEYKKTYSNHRFVVYE